MKQMSLIEMDGFLKGKCIPRDLKVNETNAEYLVRKFAEAEAKISALSEDQQRAIESIKQADSAVKLAHEKFSALAAENAKLKKFCKDAAFDADYEAELGMERGGFSDALNEIKTPATDAFLAEVRAHDLNAFIRHHSAELDAHIKNGGEQFDEKSVRIRDIIVSARLFREQIRKEAAQ
ncbi:hypothetical protein R1F07_23095 [Escherichia coli]